MYSGLITRNAKYLKNIRNLPNIFFNYNIKKRKLAIGTGLFTTGCILGQNYYGSKNDFYDFRFITDANSDDLAEFYGNEDFMEIFCVFPFVVDFMMRSGDFDDKGHVHTFGLPPLISKMIVSMQFEEKEEDDNIICFNKKERFKCVDKIFGFTLWEMVQNFGYIQREDKKCEVYHYGQQWYGPFFIRFIFYIHACYVIYATEQHINSERFLNKNDDNEDELISQRHNIPLHLVNQYIDGLENDVKNKLKNTIKSCKNIIDNEDSVDELKEKILKLEKIVNDLQKAKERRAMTKDNRTITNNNYDGSVRSMYTRSLMKRATTIENLDKTEIESLCKTIDKALDQIEDE